MSTSTVKTLATVAAIVSELALEYMEQNAIAQGDFEADYSGVAILAAHARAEQIAHDLHKITGDRKWETLMMNHRQQVTRTGQSFVQALRDARKPKAA